METPNHNSEILLNEYFYINNCIAENAELNYENYLNDIDFFSREDFENDILEENSF